jgi:hypothetical protein
MNVAMFNAKKSHGKARGSLADNLLGRAVVLKGRPNLCPSSPLNRGTVPTVSSQAEASYCKLKQAIAAYCRKFFRKNFTPPSQRLYGKNIILPNEPISNPSVWWTWLRLAVTTYIFVTFSLH